MGAVHRSSCHSNEVRNLHQRITLRIGCTRWAKGQEFFDALGLGSYLFGGLDSLSLYLQAGGAQVSAHLLMMLPYIFTILCSVVRHQPGREGPGRGAGGARTALRKGREALIR